MSRTTFTFTFASALRHAARVAVFVPAGIVLGACWRDSLGTGHGEGGGSSDVSTTGASTGSAPWTETGSTSETSSSSSSSSSGGAGGPTSSSTEGTGGSVGSNAGGGSSTESGAGGHPAGSGSGGAAGTGGAGGATPRGPAPVELGAAGNYVMLAKTAITNAPISDVTGDIGVSPAAATYITGFSMTRAGTEWTSDQVTGALFAADNDDPTPADLTAAVGDMEAAYTDAAGRTMPTSVDLGNGAIGGMTLEPGLYRWNSTVTIPSDVTIEGADDDVWIFQVTGNLEMAATMEMLRAGGARSENIVWQVAGAVNIGAEAHAEGIVLSQTSITLQTGASATGRLLSQSAVNIAGSIVTAPGP